MAGDLRSFAALAIDAAVAQAVAQERERREYVQIHGVYMGWGIISLPGDPVVLGVRLIDENAYGPYKRGEWREPYDSQPSNLGAVSKEDSTRAECAVIDRAIAAIRAPGPAPGRDEGTGGPQ